MASGKEIRLAEGCIESKETKYSALKLAAKGVLPGVRYVEEAVFVPSNVVRVVRERVEAKTYLCSS